MSICLAVGLAVVAVGTLVGIPPTIVGLALVGFGNGVWNVAMNVEGPRSSNACRRAIMPKFHAGFSVGTVGGAAVGAVMVAFGVPVVIHLLAVALAFGITVPLASRRFLPRSAEADSEHARDIRGPLVAAHSRPGPNRALC